MSCGKTDDPAFVTTLQSSHECPICLTCLRQPQHIVECGHIFCKKCLDELKIKNARAGRPFSCPLDKKVIKEGRIFTDLRLEREIDDLKAYCKNKDVGCPAICELRDYQAHVEKCGYNKVNCPLDCGEIMMSMAVGKHLIDQCRRRLMSCDLCHQSMEYRILKVEHDSVCPMKKLSCDYCRTAVVLRKELDDHYNTVCVGYPTFCMFAPLGCKEKIQRQKLESHHQVSIQNHLSMLSTAALDIYDTLGVKLPACKFGGGSVLYELPVQHRATMSENVNSARSFGGGNAERKGQADATTLQVLEKMKKIEIENKNLLKEMEKIKIANSNLSLQFKNRRFPRHDPYDDPYNDL